MSMLSPSGQIFLESFSQWEIQLQAVPNLSCLLCPGTSRKNEVYAVSKWTDLFGVIFPMTNSVTSCPQFEVSFFVQAQVGQMRSMLCPSGQIFLDSFSQ